MAAGRCADRCIRLIEMDDPHSPIDDQLGPDEQLIWVGKANSDRLLRRSDYAWVWSGVVLGTVAMAALLAAILQLVDGNGTGGLIGLAIAALLGVLALYLVFGRLARRFGATHRALYAITNERAIAVQMPSSPADAPELAAVAISRGLSPRLVMHYEGRGTIELGDLAFVNIDNAPVVFELLQAQIAGSRAAAPKLP